MTEIRFYHLQKQTLDQALPQILNKALSAGHRIIVKLPDIQSVERMNTHLWTYNPDSFLPHGSNKDGYAEDQPIWLTDKDENPNGATVMISASGAVAKTPGNYDLCCEILDGHDQDNIKAARQRWKDYKEKELDITYWQQSETGGWDKKA